MHPLHPPPRSAPAEGFLYYQFGGLVFGGAYLQNFTVCEEKKSLSSAGNNFS